MEYRIKVQIIEQYKKFLINNKIFVKLNTEIF